LDTKQGRPKGAKGADFGSLDFYGKVERVEEQLTRTIDLRAEQVARSSAEHGYEPDPVLSLREYRARAEEEPGCNGTNTPFRSPTCTSVCVRSTGRRRSNCWRAPRVDADRVLFKAGRAHRARNTERAPERTAKANGPYPCRTRAVPPP
jgi:hypothetical protein